VVVGEGKKLDFWVRPMYKNGDPVPDYIGQRRKEENRL